MQTSPGEQPVSMERAMGAGTTQLLKDYYLEKYQGDSDWWKTNFGEAKTLRQILDVIKTTFPQDVPTVAHLIVSRMNGSDPLQSERDRNRREADATFGFAYINPLEHGIPRDIKTFESFDTRDAKTSRINTSLVNGKAHAMEWASGKGVDILCLVGLFGSGKTHLAIAAAQAIFAAHPDEITFRTEADLVGEIHAAMKDGRAEAIIQAVCSVPYLVLDDLGLQATSEGGWDGTVRDRIINARYATHGARTLITTNLLSKDLSPRIASRLSEESKALVVKLDAPDHRKLKAGAP